MGHTCTGTAENLLRLAAFKLAMSLKVSFRWFVT